MCVCACVCISSQGRNQRGSSEKQTDTHRATERSKGEKAKKREEQGETGTVAWQRAAAVGSDARETQWATAAKSCSGAEKER